MFNIVLNDKYTEMSNKNELFDKFRKESGAPIYVPDFFSVNGDIYGHFRSLEWKEHHTVILKQKSFVLFNLLKHPDRFKVSLPKDFDQLISYLWGEPVRMKYVIGMRFDPGGFVEAHYDEKFYGSMILYLNPVWKESWGGKTQFRKTPDLPFDDICGPEIGGMSFAKNYAEEIEWENRITEVTEECTDPRISIAIRWAQI